MAVVWFELFKIGYCCEKENHFLPASVLIYRSAKSVLIVAYFSMREETDINFFPGAIFPHELLSRGFEKELMSVSQTR
jgi:hypothetical protein